MIQMFYDLKTNDGYELIFIFDSLKESRISCTVS